MAQVYAGADFPIAQMVKNLPAMQETRVQSLGWEDPLEKGMAIHSTSHREAWRATVSGVTKSWIWLSDSHTQGKPQGHLGMTKIKSVMTVQWKWQIDSKDYIWYSAKKLWTELWNIIQESVIKPSPTGKKKGKMVAWGSLINNWEKKEKQKAKEKRKDIPLWMQISREQEKR